MRGLFQYTEAHARAMEAHRASETFSSAQSSRRAPSSRLRRALALRGGALWSDRACEEGLQGIARLFLLKLQGMTLKDYKGLHAFSF